MVARLGRAVGGVRAQCVDEAGVAKGAKEQEEEEEEEDAVRE